MDGGPRGASAERGAIRLRCACGWEIVGPEDEVVAATQAHGQRLHNMLPSREEVLAMAAATASAVPTTDDPDR